MDIGSLMPVEPGSSLPTAGQYRRRRVPAGYGHANEGELPAVSCSAEDCDREAKARGMCWRHYKRWQRGTDG
jgi:hypothetical protein